MNPTGQPFSCGFLPCGPARSMFPVSVFRLDQNMELARDENGLCLPVKPGEPGMIMGKVRNDVLSRFDGYDRVNESRRKIVQNVFTKGDSAFMSGDIVRFDGQGWCYFVERLGDCYRWRGENISAQEVESVIKKLTGLKGTIVAIGLQLEKFDGYPPMVVLDEQPTPDNLQLFENAMTGLSRQQRPIFVKWGAKIPLTETYKVKRKDLRSDPFEDGEVYVTNGKGNLRLISKSDHDLLSDGRCLFE